MKDDFFVYDADQSKTSSTWRFGSSNYTSYSEELATFFFRIKYVFHVKVYFFEFDFVFIHLFSFSPENILSWNLKYVECLSLSIRISWN